MVQNFAFFVKIETANGQKKRDVIRAINRRGCGLDREGAKIKTTKISSEGLACNSAKFSRYTVCVPGTRMCGVG